MGEYKSKHEIFKQCSGNQMRDTFVSVDQGAAPETCVHSRRADGESIMEKAVMPDAVIFFALDLSGQKQRCSFTEI